MTCSKPLPFKTNSAAGSDMRALGHDALYDALKRGLDYSRDPGTASIHPYPQMVGNLTTFAPLAANVLRAPGPQMAPNQLVGIGQYGVLPKTRGG